MRVAAVDDDVSFFQVRQQAIDHMIDGIAGLHHQHHAARLLQRLNQLRNRVGAYYLRAFGFVVEEVVNLGDGSIEYGNAVSMIVHVQDQILAHHGEADESDVAAFCWHNLSFYLQSSSMNSLTVKPACSMIDLSVPRLRSLLCHGSVIRRCVFSECFSM